MFSLLFINISLLIIYFNIICITDLYPQAESNFAEERAVARIPWPFYASRVSGSCGLLFTLISK